ncbi:MAG: histidinol-phosphate transaminase [Vulcanimicrobiaceae bacterium]
MTRRVVRALAPYKAGTSIEEVRARFGLEHIIKLASNENPLGSSPKAIAALKHVDGLNLYFDDAHVDLKAKLAAPYGLAAENVVLGHGSNELVNLIAETLLEPGDEAVMATPSFLLYRLATAVRGATAVEVPLRDGRHDLDAMLGAITQRTKLVFVCDPNNPTGTALDARQWEDLLARLPSSVMLAIDRAYCEYMDAGAPDAIAFVTRRPNTIVLRTMSKIYGLAGLRFGYGFADAQSIGWLERVRLPFNVSRPAALGAWAALDDSEFVQRSIDVNEAGKTYLGAAFARLGLRAYPTQANFIAVEMPVDATRAYEALLERGIIVRSGDTLHMPGRLRVTIGAPEQNRELIAALEALTAVWRG